MRSGVYVSEARPDVVVVITIKGNKYVYEQSVYLTAQPEKLCEVIAFNIDRELAEHFMKVDRLFYIGKL